MNDADDSPGMKYEVRDGLYYTDSHEWVMAKDGKAVVGMTDYAQQELGNVVYVDLPSVGSEVSKDAEFGAMESVKTIQPIYSPVPGKVTAVNGALQTAPETINASPYDDGWIAELDLADESAVSGLMDAGAYRDMLDRMSI